VKKAYADCFGSADYDFGDLAAKEGSTDSDNDGLPDSFENNEQCFYKKMGWVNGAGDLDPDAIKGDLAGLESGTKTEFDGNIDKCASWNGDFGSRRKREVGEAETEEEASNVPSVMESGSSALGWLKAAVRKTRSAAPGNANKKPSKGKKKSGRKNKARNQRRKGRKGGRSDAKKSKGKKKKAQRNKNKKAGGRRRKGRKSSRSDAKKSKGKKKKAQRNKNKKAGGRRRKGRKSGKSDAKKSKGKKKKSGRNKKKGRKGGKKSQNNRSKPKKGKRNGKDKKPSPKKENNGGKGKGKRKGGNGGRNGGNNGMAESTYNKLWCFDLSLEQVFEKCVENKIKN